MVRSELRIVGCFGRRGHRRARWGRGGALGAGRLGVYQDHLVPLLLKLRSGTRQRADP